MTTRTTRAILVVMLACLACQVTAQPPEVMWTRTFGTTGDLAGSCVQQTMDGGFIVLSRFGIMIKLDADGNELWRASTGVGTANYIIETTDGGLLATGSGNWGMGDDTDFLWLEKSDSLGGQEWFREWDGPANDGGYCVHRTSDGGYIVSGYYGTQLPVSNDPWLIKTDSLGIELWNNTYNGSGGECVQETPDHGFITISDNDDVSMIKTDSTGTEVWRNEIGGLEIEWGKYIVTASDGGYVVAGAQDYNTWICKADQNGIVEWERLLGGEDAAGADCIQKTADNGYIVAGTVFNPGYSYDIQIFKTDLEGNELWSLVVGSTQQESCQYISQTSDGGYIVVGSTFAWGVDTEIYVFRLGADEPQARVTLYLVPHNLPIQIPAAGGTFTFDVSITNTLVEARNGQVWTCVTLPNGNIYSGAELYLLNLHLIPGVPVMFTDVMQVVPSYAPAGSYIYHSCIGRFQNQIFAVDSFEFEKLAPDLSGN